MTKNSIIIFLLIISGILFSCKSDGTKSNVATTAEEKVKTSMGNTSTSSSEIANLSLDELRKQSRVTQRQITNLMNKPVRKKTVEQRKDVTKKLRETKDAAAKKALEKSRSVINKKLADIDKASGLSDLLKKRDTIRKRIAELNKK